VFFISNAVRLQSKHNGLFRIVVNFWFSIGAIGMALGSTAFAWLGTAAPEKDKHSYMTSFFITLIAGTMYMALAINQGNVAVEGGRTVYYARYLTWSMTTPLLLLSLASVALRGGLGQNVPLVAGLIGADVYMILTGLVAELSGSPNKYIWYAVSTAAFLAMLYLIWGPLRAEADSQDPPRRTLWERLALVLSVLWCGYPLVWLVGPPGLGLIPPAGQNFAFVTLDLLAKVGWGFLLLLGLRRLEREGQSASDGRSAAQVGGERR
jgi:bacteriorhodopsin